MLNLVGKHFGRLTVVEMTDERQGKSIVWKCICRCGNMDARISARDLLNARKGCGVCRDSEHPLYGIYRGIIARCEDTKSLAYKHYGGRGIKICSRWREDFLNFVEDIGPRPSNYYSIDRIDVNGNYEKSNTRWAAADMQANNKQNIQRGLTEEQILIIFKSKDMDVKLALKFNVSVKTIKNIKLMHYSTKATDICVKSMIPTTQLT